MARLIALVTVVSALVLPGCGLTLDYAPPDDAGLDGGPRDAAFADANGADAAQPDVDAAGDAGIDAALPDANVGCVGATDCPSGAVCVVGCDGAAEGHCASTESCAEIEVCGCDGQVYPTACEAHLAGVEVASDPSLCPDVCVPGDPGTCLGGDCVACPGELPVCQVGPDPVCILEPVCGCDGNNYLGRCDAVAAGVRTFASGFCDPGDCTTSADCAFGHYCARTECDAVFGRCEGIPTVRDPLVCGCSGRRYIGSGRALLTEGLLGSCDPCTTRPASCCADSADCGASGACVHDDTTGALCIDSGACVDLRALLLESACWTSADCDPGVVCIGAQICPCGATCLRPDEPGLCGIAP